jgi:hypothetical protein
VPAKDNAHAKRDDDDAHDAAWIALGRLGKYFCDTPVAADLYAALTSPRSQPARSRDLFPLPLIDQGAASELLGNSSSACGYAMVYLDAVVVGLNLLYGVQFHSVTVGKPTLAQRTSHDIIIKAALALHCRFMRHVGDRGDGGWAHFEKGRASQHPDLVAEAVAVPDVAGTCDPLTLVSPQLKSLINVPAIFPTRHEGLRHFGSITGRVRPEYIALTVRQLRCGMLRLASQCNGGASVFAVGKAGGKQRVVWNGTKLSAAASRPPAPRHLADPAAFGMLDLADADVLRVTKRDCRTWFDQLALSDDIGSFFGKPSITRTELNRYGIDDVEISSLGGDAQAASFFPCYKVWPMGFAWSSCIAQDTLLGVCSRAGLDESLVLAADTPLPNSLSVAFAVATDDLMFLFLILALV